MTYFSHKIDTPLGSMIAVGDETALHLLVFSERDNLENELKKYPLLKPGKTKPIESIEKELFLYFKNKDYKFETPLQMNGSPFEIKVWKALQKIPPSTTTSYSSLSGAIGKEKATRAVGSAIGRNPFAILIPCHRVVRKNGDLGGYNGGIDKKQWLLKHEK
jgi:AraC family transcriptional regulator of adaptative response/methylated-DNA-[protein]-cysteine methyltransferase